MKFTVIKNEILPFLNMAINFTSPKNVNTILQNFYIEAEDDQITIRATNLQTGICMSIPAKIEQTGETTVSAKKFLDIIRELPDSSLINMELTNSKLKIKSEKSTFNLSILSPEQFPTMTDITPEYSIKVNSDNLLKTLKKTYFCISTDPTKPEYNGAHFKVYGNTLEVSSADFQRIATSKFNFSEEYYDEFIINIPKKTISEVMKILEYSEYTEIETDKRQVQFKIGNITVFSKLIEKYIRSMTKLLESEYAINIKIPTKEFHDAIKRVSVISSDTTHGVVFSFENDKVSIYSIETEYGQGFETINNIELNGEEIEIMFNSKKLLEILSNVDSDFFTFKMNGRKNPTVIEPEEINYSYLIVPISIETY
jgi:DNA polymerase-3 subunit beta